jgi:hypothetical protein
MKREGTYGKGWWPADEMMFIRQIPELCAERNSDPIACLRGYLKSLPSRKDWGRYIRESDIQEFISEAQLQLKLLKSH